MASAASSAMACETTGSPGPAAQPLPEAQPNDCLGAVHPSFQSSAEQVHDDYRSPLHGVLREQFPRTCSFNELEALLKKHDPLAAPKLRKTLNRRTGVLVKLRSVFSCKNKALSQSQTEAEQRANEKKKEEREKKTKKKSGAKRQKRASRVANCNFFVKLSANVSPEHQLDNTRKLRERELTWTALERQMMHGDHARTDSGQSEKEKEAKKIACSLGASHADTLMYMMKTAGRGHTNVPSRSQTTKDTAVDFAHDANRRWAHLVGTWRPDQATLVSAFMLADAECAVTLAFHTEAALASSTPLYYVHLLPSEDEIFLIEGEELTGRLMVPPGPQGDRGSANCVSIADLLRIIRRHRPQRDVASTHWTSFPKEDEHWSTPYHSLTIEQALDGVRNEDRSQQDLIKDCYAVLESATRIRRFHATMPSPSHANDPSTAIPADPPRKADLLLPSRMVQSRSQSAGRVQLAVLAFLPVPLCLRSSRTLTMAEFDTTFCTSSLGLNIFDMHCVDGDRKYHPCLMAQITADTTLLFSSLLSGVLPAWYGASWQRVASLVSDKDSAMANAVAAPDVPGVHRNCSYHAVTQKLFEGPSRVFGRGGQDKTAELALRIALRHIRDTARDAGEVATYCDNLVKALKTGLFPGLSAPAAPAVVVAVRTVLNSVQGWARAYHKEYLNFDTATTNASEGFHSNLKKVTGISKQTPPFNSLFKIWTFLYAHQHTVGWNDNKEWRTSVLRTDELEGMYRQWMTGYAAAELAAAAQRAPWYEIEEAVLEDGGIVTVTVAWKGDDADRGEAARGDEEEGMELRQEVEGQKPEPSVHRKLNRSVFHVLTGDSGGRRTVVTIDPSGDARCACAKRTTCGVACAHLLAVAGGVAGKRPIAVYLYKAYLTGKLSKSFVDENWDQPFLVDVETVQKLLAGEVSTARIAAGPCSGQMMEWENLEEYEVPEPHGGGGLDSARSLYLDCALGAMRAADAVLGQKKEQECQRLAEAELAEKRLEELGKQLEECKGQVVELRRQLAVASAQTVQASEVRDGLCRTISYANGNDEVLSRIRDLLVEREAERLISEPNFTANDARELLAALSALQAEDEPALPGGLPLPAVATTPFRPAYGGPAVTNSHLHRPARKRRRRGGVDEGEIAAGLSAFERRLAAGLAPGEESAFFPEPSGHDSNSSDGGSRVLPCKRVASPPSSGMRAAEASSVYPNVNVDLASTPLPSDGTRTEMSSAPTQLDEGSGSRSRALQELIAEAATNPQAGRRQRFRTAPHNMALTYAFPKHTGGSSY